MRWNRKWDFQFIRIILVLSVTITIVLLLPLHSLIKAIFILVIFIAGIYLDAKTIKLWPSQKRRGWRAMLGDKVNTETK
jgi:hypothetical protein